MVGIGGFAIACALGAAVAHAAPRFWIELPRASVALATYETLPQAPPPTPRAIERRLRKGRRDRVELLSRGPRPADLRVLEELGLKVHYLSRWLSAVSVEANPEQLLAIRRRLPSARIRPVRTWTRPLPRPAESGLPESRPKAGGFDYGASWIQNQQIQTDQMHDLGFTGEGVRVLILDTGFLRTHPAFGRLRVVDEWDFVFGDSLTRNEAVDVPAQHNHGTGTLGVLAGWAPGELIGPAFGAEFLLAKTEKLDTETRVEEDNFVAALEWGEARGADLITASLGYLSFPDSPDSFSYTFADLDGNTAVTTRAMDDIVALGVLALSAIGNSGAKGASSLITPSDGDSVLAIGSVLADSTVSAFSSRGPTADGRIKPDLMARGTATIWAAADSTFRAASGTSLATPLAAGAAVLVLQAHPEWGPGAAMNALRSTATLAATPNNDHGWGIVQSWRASFEFEAPIYPLPFDLLAPADSTSLASGPITFRWRRATDLQGGGCVYRLELSARRDFSTLLAAHDAGTDSTRSLSFLPGGAFYWRVVATDPEGHERPTVPRLLSLQSPTASVPAPAPLWGILGHPTPNPFNPRVRLDFVLDRSAELRAEIYDVAGRRVRRLFDGALAEGEHRWVWEGEDDRGRMVSSGVYLFRLEATARDGGTLRWGRRLVLVR